MSLLIDHLYDDLLKSVYVIPMLRDRVGDLRCLLRQRRAALRRDAVAHRFERRLQVFKGRHQHAALGKRIAQELDPRGGADIRHLNMTVDGGPGRGLTGGLHEFEHRGEIGGRAAGVTDAVKHAGIVADQFGAGVVHVENFFERDVTRVNGDQNGFVG